MRSIDFFSPVSSFPSILKTSSLPQSDRLLSTAQDTTIANKECLDMDVAVIYIIICVPVVKNWHKSPISELWTICWVGALSS